MNTKNEKAFFRFVLAVLALIALILAWGGAAQCQTVDITVPRPTSDFAVIARGAQFGATGGNNCTVSVCGVNSNFILQTLYPQEILTISLFNSSPTTNAILTNFTIAATNDTGVSTFAGNQQRWTTPTGFNSGTGQVTGITVNHQIAGSSTGKTANVFIQTNGAAKIVIIIGGSVAINDGALDISISQTATNTSSLSTNAVLNGGQNVSNIGIVSWGQGSISGGVVTGLQDVQSFLPVFLTDTTLAGDAINNSNVGLWPFQSSGLPSGTGPSAFAPWSFNGSTWDRERNQSSANVTLAQNSTGSTLTGMNIVTSPAGWTVPVQATTASQCSASVASSATTRHCAIGVEACLVSTAAQTQLFVNLRDGATGAGTVKWNAIIAGTAGNYACVVHEFSAGPVCGSLNTAMTLELSAATAATNGCAITLRGYDVQ